MADIADTEARCSFCGKNPTQVDILIAGADGYICDECVGVCWGMVRRERGRTPPTPEAWAASIEDMGTHWLVDELRSLQREVAELSEQLGRVADLAEMTANPMEHA